MRLRLRPLFIVLGLFQPIWLGGALALSEPMMQKCVSEANAILYGEFYGLGKTFCSGTDQSEMFEFRLTSGPADRSRLASSTVSALLQTHPSDEYILRAVPGTPKLFRVIFLIGEGTYSFSQILPTTSFLFDRGDDVVWVRCTQGVDNGCIFYTDVCEQPSASVHNRVIYLSSLFSSIKITDSVDTAIRMAKLISSNVICAQRRP